jgi:hypothetical protein
MVYNTGESPTIENNCGITNDGEGTGIFSSSITNLDPETLYYARAYAINLDDTVYGQERMFKTAPANIGESYQGGIVAYIFQPGDPGYIDNESHGLIAAPYDLGNARWGCTYTFMGAVKTELGTGDENTQAISGNCSETYIAAKLCDDWVLNGYDDWFLPSKDELYKLFLNQDSIGGFSNTATYWSSSEEDDSEEEYEGDYDYYGWAHSLTFYHGSAIIGSKENSNKVRAIRYF